MSERVLKMTPLVNREKISYDTGSSNKSMPLTRARKYLRSVKSDVGSSLLYFRMAMQGNKVRRLTDFSNCKHPVLLLYGFGATRRIFGVLERRLRQDGYGVFSVNLGGIFDTFNTRCIEESARLVRDKIERLTARFNLRKITIIGHSKGGLIGLYYIKKLGGDKRVHTLVTLGTPHNGNPWALLGMLSPLAFLSKSLRQMIPYSPFIRKLNKTPLPKSVKLVSIYSKADRICYYRGAIVKANGKNIKNIELMGMSHSDYIIRKTAYNAIHQELGPA